MQKSFSFNQAESSTHVTWCTAWQRLATRHQGEMWPLRSLQQDGAPSHTAVRQKHRNLQRDNLQFTDWAKHFVHRTARIWQYVNKMHWWITTTLHVSWKSVGLLGRKPLSRSWAGELHTVCAAKEKPRLPLSCVLVRWARSRQTAMNEMKLLQDVEVWQIWRSWWCTSFLLLFR